MTEVPDLAAAIGTRLRELRTGRGRRQEDVAQAARLLGLRWNRATLAALEHGIRSLSPGEFLLLPLILRIALEQPVELLDLLPSQTVEVAPGAQVPSSVLELVLSGRASEVSPSDVEAVPLVKVRPEEFLTEIVLPADGAPLGLPGVRHDSEARYLGLQLVLDARGEAERKVAARLGVPPEVIAVLAMALWRRTLGAERDARVAKTAQKGSPRTLQALRGHVTRELVRELEPAVRGAKDRLRTLQKEGQQDLERALQTTFGLEVE